MTTTITIYTAFGDERATIGIYKGAKGTFALGSEDYITLPFVAEEPIPFAVGDWCDLAALDEGLATNFRKEYVITETPFPDYDMATGGYKYELKMEAYYYQWRNLICKYFTYDGEKKKSSSESSWQLVQTIGVHLDVIVRNLTDAEYYYNGLINGVAFTNLDYTYSVDMLVVSTEAKLVSYNNMNIIDALTTLANTYECEWWVEGNVIHMGRCENGEAITLSNETNVTSTERNDSSGEYATRLYVYGSEKNIPVNYREIESNDIVTSIYNKRLMLPTSWKNVEDTHIDYVDAYRYGPSGERVYIGEDGYDTGTEMLPSEAVEGVITNDDIYPSFKATIKEVYTWNDAEVDEDGNETGKLIPFFCFTTDDFEFSKDYIISGETLGITFTSGPLNGMSFDLDFHENGFSHYSSTDETTIEVSGQVFEIVANEDYGTQLPDATLYPAAKNEFVITGWDSTAINDTTSPMYGKVEEAEQKLLEYGKEYVQKSMIDDGVYKVTLASHVVAEDSTLLMRLGQRVSLVNPAFFDNTRVSRVIGYEIALDIPFDAPVFSIGESVKYSITGELSDKIDEITMNGLSYSWATNSTRGGSYIYLIRTNDTTASTNANTYSAKRIDADFFRNDNIITYSSTTTPSNSNVYSANRVKKQYFDKLADEESVAGLTSFVKGLQLGESPTMGVAGSGGILKMLTDSDGNATDSYLEVDRMLVRKVATFVELAIHTLKHTGGEIILSDASLTVSMVVPSASRKSYRLYFNNSDGDTTIENEFEVGDLARSQTFNNNNSHYWWRQVTEVGDDYIVVSNLPAQKDSESDIPAVGDVVVQLGNIGDTERQNAIILSTIGEDSPSLKMYSGINSFSLEGCSNTYFSSQGNKITGNFVFTSGVSVQTSVENIEADVDNLETDVTDVKTDVSEVKTDVTNVKASVKEVESNIENVGTRLSIYTQSVGKVQKTDEDGNPLYYDASNNETTAATRTEVVDGKSTIVNNDKVLITINTTNNGLVTNAEYAALKSTFSDSDGNFTEASIKTAIKDQASEVEITADRISLEGYTTINGGVQIDTNGNLIAQNGTFGGVLKSTLATASHEEGNSIDTPMYVFAYTEDTNSATLVNDENETFQPFEAVKVSNSVNLDMSDMQFAILPSTPEWVSTRVLLYNGNDTDATKRTYVVVENAATNPTEAGLMTQTIRGVTDETGQLLTAIGWQSGTIELLCTRHHGDRTWWGRWDAYTPAQREALGMDTELGRVEWWVVSFNAEIKYTDYRYPLLILQDNSYDL